VLRPHILLNIYSLTLADEVRNEGGQATLLTPCSDQQVRHDKEFGRILETCEKSKDEETNFQR
jgi:hypothetical protein